MTYKTARVKVLSNFVNWKEAEEYDVDENTSTRELITSVLHRHGMTSRDPNLFYLTLEGRSAGTEESPGWSMNLSDEALVMTARDTKNDGHFAMHMRQGGLVKIYDESIMPGSYYKSLFISKRTSSREVVSLLLASYGKNESADNFVLVEQTSKGKEVRTLKTSEFPLVVDQTSHQTTLHLKRVKQQREKKSTLSRSQTISSAQDLQSRSGISREATVVRLRESFRRLQRLRADQEMEVDALVSTPRVSTKFALSEESLDTTGASSRKSGFNSTLGKISKKLSSLTNIKSYSDKNSSGLSPRTGLGDDALRSSARSSSLHQQHSAADLLARVGLPGGSPRSSKRYSFPPASADVDLAGEPSPHSSPRSARRAAPRPASPSSPRTPRRAAPRPSSPSSPRSPRRAAPRPSSPSSPRREPRPTSPTSPTTAAIQHAFSSPRSPRRQAPRPTSPPSPNTAATTAIQHAFSSPRSERRSLPKSYATTTTTNTTTAAVPDPLGLSPRSQRRHRSFNTHSVYTSRQPPMSAREADRSIAAGMGSSGSMSARSTRDYRLPLRTAGENGGNVGASSSSSRRQLPQPPGNTTATSTGLSDMETRRRLLALEAQRRLRMMAVSSGTSAATAVASARSSLRHYPARPLASSPSKLQAKTKARAPLPPTDDLRLALRGLIDDSDNEGGSPSTSPVVTARRAEPLVADNRNGTDPGLSRGVQTDDPDTTSSSRSRAHSSHPSLFDVVEQCEVFTARLTRRSMWHKFGVACFEAIFTPNGPGAGSAHHSPRGRRPVLGRSTGAFQAVNASALASIRSLIAVDSLEDESEGGGLREGDYLLEVNGISVLSSAPQQVESLINSFLTVEITGARGRSEPRAGTSASSTEGATDEASNSDLERQLTTLRNKYAQLKQETKKNESLIAELRDAVSKKVRVRVGGSEATGRNVENSFRAIRSGVSEEVVSTV